MASLLIIGGTGFFGKSILDGYKRELLNSWKIDKVIIMSRNAIDFKQNYPELVSSGVEFLVGDISTIDFLPEADFVIHAAASTDTSRYIFHSEEEKNNIIAGTLNYCKLAKKFHKKSRIVYCSSGAVYGHQSEILQTDSVCRRHWPQGFLPFSAQHVQEGQLLFHPALFF